MPSCGASLARGLKKLGSPIFSQTRDIQQRRQKGLHPISELSRFHLLVCCFFCSVCVSLTYAFDLFTTEFRRQFKLTSSDLTIISTVGLVCCYFTIPYTFIFQEFGPFSIFWLCAVVTAIGGVGLAGIFSGHITGNTATITVFYAFLNMASGLIDTSYVTTIVEVFPRNRGPIIGLVKVMTGLGSSVFAAMSSTFFEGSIDGFIYFIMALVMVVCIWASFVIVLPPYIMNSWRSQGKTEEQIAALKATVTYYERKFVPIPRLIVGYVVVLVLFIFLTVEASVLAYVTSVSKNVKIAIGVMTVVLTCAIFLMLLPLRILGGVNERDPGAERLEEPEEAVRTKDVYEEGCLAHPDDVGQEMCTSNEGGDEVSAPLRTATDGMDTSSHREGGINKSARQDPRYEGTVKDYLLNVDVWLIMLLFICYGCMGVIVLFNSSTVSIALTGQERSAKMSALYTAFLGVGSSIGRVGFGLFEAYVQHQDPDNRKVLVTMALPVSPAMAFFAGIFFLFLPGDSILLPLILVYMEEGIFAGINALIFPCLFESNHNFLYNLSFFVQMCCIISFNLGMFGRIIDREQRKLNIPMDLECNVKSCVRTPIIVSTVLAFVGFFVALAIHLRYAAFVKRTRERLRALGTTNSEPTAGAVPVEGAKQRAAADASVNS
ncbi:hypothetical protein, unknown function [Leishmania tarentolae]|uniref:Nodulin-like domain-containing protein n=1 Tax=Leishmania tarentolae TaxID=5689 RepID=A0A640KLV6_LEITA|nr:hypothetical protein, unknown function [Leishmania tarentolae]